MHLRPIFVFVASTLLVGLAPVPARAQAPDPRFGIVEAFVNSAAATEAGAGYTRIVLRWDVIQPANRDDWKPANVPDPLIEAELAAGRQVVAVLIGTPAWAARNPADGARSVPVMDAWAGFARRMAEHYRGRIGHWIIWNEPDVWEVGHPGQTWAGTVQEYAELLKTAYLAIKGIDPTQQVHIAGLTYFWDWAHGRPRYLDRLLDVLSADPEAASHGFYFDAAIYHLYFNPNQTPQVLAEARASLLQHGISGKDLWINETNAPPSDDPQEPPWSPPRFMITQAEQAAFVIQEFSLAFAAGAGRVSIYKLRNTADHPESIEPYGLLRGDDSLRPAYGAYKTVTTYLRDFQTVRREQRGNIEAITFERGDRTTTVLWTTSRRLVRVVVRAISAEALLVDEHGDAQTLSAVNGAYNIILPAAACSNTPCTIGGAPRLLVELGVAPGRAALFPLPAPISTPQPVRATRSPLTSDDVFEGGRWGRLGRR